jgi:iron(III) transport system substrate-binding protein
MGFPVHGLIGAAAMLLLAGSPARADALSDLAAAAAKKGPVIWYESSPPEQILKVAAAFNKRHPGIKIQYVRNTGGGGIAARVIQESEAGAATASFFIGDVAQLIPLEQRGLLLARDWPALGLDPALVTTPYAVSSIAALGPKRRSPSCSGVPPARGRAIRRRLC